MSEIAKRQMAAVKEYQQTHPEVDWSTHVVYIKPTVRPITEDSEWVATGHQPRDERDELLARCCVPDCPTHREGP